jgi:antitoxin ParD1/3/4
MSSRYTLDSQSETFVNSMVESGRYRDASDVVREGLRLLEEQEALAAFDPAELRRLAEEGRLSGLSEEDGEEFLAKLEAKYRAMALERARQD